MDLGAPMIRKSENLGTPGDSGDFNTNHAGAATFQYQTVRTFPITPKVSNKEANFKIAQKVMFNDISLTVGLLCHLKKDPPSESQKVLKR